METYTGGLTITEPVRREPQRLKIYALLVEGKAQANIVSITGLSKGQVSKITASLEAGEYVKAINPKARPLLYEKGPKVGELDALLVTDKFPFYATGVTNVSKKVCAGRHREGSSIEVPR